MFFTYSAEQNYKVLITGHRGMGVSNKRRDLLIPGAEFFPENSIAAFKEAIRLGADYNDPRKLDQQKSRI
jgi:glycerophosphoryl diester phosphodiesterase